MTDRYIKVKDVDGAVRDRKSNAVLFSASKSQQAKARKRYARKLKESEHLRIALEEKAAIQEQRINKLEKLVNKILEEQK